MAIDDTGEAGKGFHLEDGIPVFDARLNKVESKQAEAETRDANYKKEQLRIDLGMLIFTGALVACSVLSAVVSLRLANVANISAQAAQRSAETAAQTLKEIQKSGTDTRTLADSAIKQVDAMNKQAENTKESLAQSERYFHISEQPYITFGRKDGVLAQLNESKDPDQEVGLVLYLQNAGRLPAQTVCVWTVIEVREPNLYIRAEPDNQKNLLIRQRKRNFIGISRVLHSSCPSIGGDSTYAHTTEKTFQQHILDEFKRVRELPGFSSIDVRATVQYCDPFGHYQCETAELSYGRDRTDSFRLESENSCKENYGEQPRIDPAIYRAFGSEPLPPCASPSEQVKDAKEAARAAKAESDAMNPN